MNGQSVTDEDEAGRMSDPENSTEPTVEEDSL